MKKQLIIILLLLIPIVCLSKDLNELPTIKGNSEQKDMQVSKCKNNLLIRNLK